jgi:hypothetical protein
MLPAGRALRPGGHAHKGAKHATVCAVGFKRFVFACLLQKQMA